VSKRRSLLLPAIIAAAVFALLIGLGVWQVQRKAWKENLIATLAERMTAPPSLLPPHSQWQSLTPQTDEFRRVRLRVQFDPKSEARVYSGGSGLREDVKAPGYFAFAPARLPDGSMIVINRGHVDNASPDASLKPIAVPTAAVEIVGALRWPEPRGLFAPADNPARNQWFVRDHLAMAAAKDWGPVAPFFVDQEAPVPPGGLPKPGKITPNLRNDHLQYALTWYGLALVLVAVFLVWLRSRAREARLNQHNPERA
jgi:surfeit locus 1 family protein